MTAPSAWSIFAAMAAAQSALSRLQASGDVDTDEAAALAVLAQEAPDVDVVLVRLLRAKGEADANADAVKDRITALERREARFARQSEEYRRTVEAILDALGLRSWKHAEFTVSLRDGRPGVVITDPDAVPDEFVRVERKPDKTLIRAAFERGHAVPGAELANGSPVITIRTK